MLTGDETARVSGIPRTNGEDPVQMIVDELQRQAYLGYTPEVNDTHIHGELAEVAACFAAGAADLLSEGGKALWPAAWGKDVLAINTRIRQLVIAAALCTAEIERLQRARPAEIAAGNTVDLPTLEF